MLRKIGSLRAGLLAIVALGAVGAAIAVLVLTRTGSTGQEPSTRSEQHTVGPSGQEGPVTVVVQNYPTNPAPPVIKGAFRLLAFGTSDPSTPVPQSTCVEPRLNAEGTPLVLRVIDARTPAANTAIAVASLYVSVGYVPAAFQYAPPIASEVCGEIRGISWTLQGSGTAIIEIIRRKEQPPFSVRIPPIDSSYTLEEGVVGQHQAIFERNKPGRPGSQTVHFADGDIVTEIRGNVSDFQELVKVAEALK